MKKYLGIKNKYLYTLLIVLSFLLVLLAIFLTFHFLNLEELNNQSASLIDCVNTSVTREVIVEDPTKINIPQWGHLIIVIGIFTIIGILAIGIIAFLIYIIIYFIKRKHSKLAVVIDQENNMLALNQQDNFSDVIRVSIDEKGVVNEEN